MAFTCYYHHYIAIASELVMEALLLNRIVRMLFKWDRGNLAGQDRKTAMDYSKFRYQPGS